MEISLDNANKLFRDKKFHRAKAIYESLLDVYPKSFHDYIKLNIDFCNREIQKVTSTEDEFDKVYSNSFRGWTAIITLWKRTDYLIEQLEAIMDQTIPPDTIIIIQNENHFNFKELDLSRFPIKVIRSDLNSLYTRWIIGYLANSKYVNVFDDDVIPGRKWIESCIRVCEAQNALVGPSGRIAKPGKSPAWQSVDINVKGDPKYSCNDKDVECDWVCNSYFFKTEWIKYITAAERYSATQKTFDDIQLATTLRYYGGIRVFVPKQPKNEIDRNGHTKRHYGHDEFALWKRASSDHTDQRNKLIQKINNSDYQWVKV